MTSQIIGSICRLSLALLVCSCGGGGDATDNKTTYDDGRAHANAASPPWNSNWIGALSVVLGAPSATQQPKQIALSWATTGAGAASITEYRVQLRANNQSELVQIAGGIGPGSTATAVSLPNLVALHWGQASVGIQACKSDGQCVQSNMRPLAPVLAAAVGYFKASNTGQGDAFGTSVALSADGNTLAIGATGEASSSNGIGGNAWDNSAAHSGAVYVFARTAGVWSQQAYLKASNSDPQDSFGASVALSADGNTLAVGAETESSGADGVGGNQQDNSAPFAGAVYVFSRSVGAWGQQAYVKASNSDANDRFGQTLALSADGSVLAVGASGEDSAAAGLGGNSLDNSSSNSGAAYVFVRNAGLWSQQAYLKASNSEAEDWFGGAVALSADGNTLAVSARQEGSAATGVGGNQTDNSAKTSGAVYVFTRSMALWSQRAYIKASNTDVNDYFGKSIALSADGNTLAVGATQEDSNATGVGGDQSNDSLAMSGAVYIFEEIYALHPPRRVWAQRAYIKASNADSFDRFGSAVALSANGTTLAVRAGSEASGATGIGGIETDNSAPGSGAAYVFTKSNGVWSQRAYVKAPNSEAQDSFGASLALSADGSTLVAASPGESSNATGVGGDRSNNLAPGSGAVYLY